LSRLPAGSGFVFRHYHLEAGARAKRFAILSARAREHRHVVVVAGDAATARSLAADGRYGAANDIGPADGMLRIATAHDGDELETAIRAGADGVFLSPVFRTASHPGAGALGVHGFHVLAQQSPVPVIALGGMTYARADELAWPRWGAIDGLVSPNRA